MPRFLQILRSLFQKVELGRSRSPDLPVVRAMLWRGKLRLDAPSVNYSFGTLHTVLAAALQQVDVRRRAPRSVLVLGLGAGSIVHLLRRTHGITAPIVAVELDPEVVRLARTHFGLDRWNDLDVVVDDAARFVVRDARRFDLVVVDVFQDAKVPAPLRTAPFVQALHERTAPGGLLLFNVVADPRVVDAEVDTLEATLRAVFPDVRALTVARNVVFVGERAR
ncbi:MAG: fused MFS/spermidine synthase [Planctomycetes bacterium]|nr:fused MFS/spermidine synthase [Planctomycetota bacterium]